MINFWDKHIRAELMRIRSQSDLPYQVGCSIYTPNGLIASRGYNTEITDEFSWLGTYARMKADSSYPAEYPVYYGEIIHAEAMALARLSEYTSDCTMYCTLEPCIPCANFVLNSGKIVEFRYLWDYASERKEKAHLFDSGVPLLKAAGIKVGRIDV